MPTTLQLEREAADAARALPNLLADAESLAATMTAGAHGRRRAGMGETFWQYRDYSVGDPISVIDWRQSARAPKRLYVRETEWETAATVRLWVGSGPSMSYASTEDVPTKNWRSNVLCLAIAILLNNAGERLALLPGDQPGRRGPTLLMQMAESLLGHHSMEAELPPLPPGQTAQAIYISDFYLPTDDLLKQITAIAATGVRTHFVAVADRAEATFPFKGRTIFKSLTHGVAPFLFGDASAVKDAYQERREAHLQALEDQCRRYGFTFLRHYTDKSAAPVMAALHQAIGGQV